MPNKILIIDDDNEESARIRGYLQRKGFKVEQAYSANSGLALAKKINPRLILLDLVLPDQSGFRLCQEIKSRPELAGIPIVAISLKKDAIDKYVAAKSGFVAYIEKPVTEDALLFQVRDIIGSEL